MAHSAELIRPPVGGLIKECNMPDDLRNPYETWDFPPIFEPKFTNTHIISHTLREFCISFGVSHPPTQKVTPVVQLLLTKEHLMELILNLQSQLKQFNENTGGDKGKPTPPTGRF